MKNIFTTAILVMATVTAIHAQPATITWQGKLLDNSGNAITQNNVAMTFAMFDASTGGNKLWPLSGVVTKTVNVVQGLYSVQLGTSIGDDIAFNSAMFNGETPWLEVKVGTETLPRTEITNVPFALISNELSATGWESPGEIGKTTPNTGMFTTVETGSMKVTSGASAGKVLTSDADGNASWQNATLINFEESNYTLGTKTGVKLKAKNSASDVDLVLSPKGTGAILAQQPDSFPTGGMNRGKFAVDLQMFRLDSTQVASGNYATIPGGLNNTASGDYSLATGFSTTASGVVSTALGLGTTASGLFSTAMGIGTKASGTYSTALGYESNSVGGHSIAVGLQSYASGSVSIAIGNADTATGGISLAMGHASRAAGLYASAIGNKATATGENAVAIGNGTMASGEASTAMGNQSYASGKNSTAMGHGTTARSAFETVVGQYNSDYTPASTTGWDDNDRLFVVGNGENSAAKSDALMVLKNANTTIGGSLTINSNGANGSLTLPLARGTNGQFLKSNGDGTTGWGNISKSDIGLSNVENTAISTWTGSLNITTLGTINTGIWSGSVINASYIGDLSTSKITSGTFDNARIKWAQPGAIGSTTPASGAFTSLSANNGLTVSNGTVNIKPSGSGGTNGQVLTTDGTGNATWKNAPGGSSVSTQTIRVLICVNGLYPSGTLYEHFIGEIILFAGSSNYIPDNFMDCKGQTLSVQAYPALFTVIGNQYGGNGTTTFNLPNFTGKVPLGL